MVTQAVQDQEQKKTKREKKKREKGVRLTKKVLANKRTITPLCALSLAKELRKRERFKEARNLLAKVLNEDFNGRNLRLKLTQQYALCTYKDPGLPNEARLNRAFQILEGLDEVSKYLADHEEPDDRGPASTTNQETLGLAGSIFKLKWEADRNSQHLWRALGYYLRGYKVGVGLDDGYTAINAAFLLDLLANFEAEYSKEVGTKLLTSEENLKERAEAIRKQLVQELALESEKAHLGKGSWYCATAATAYFGLEQYEKASSWLNQINPSEVEPWEKRSIIQPLVQLASFKRDGNEVHQKAQKVVAEFVGDEQTVSSFFTLFKGQKVGLALSGGGFRASLFHLGVLARLAELDVLRHIEVLSCVSGGSIVGAHYYLELRQLLQKNADNEIKKVDYVALIDQMTTTFLRGVQQNLRTRIVLNPWFSLKMLWRQSYSQTLRLGELFEEQLYAKVKDGEGGKPRWLNEMAIVPRDHEGKPYADFHPNKYNWSRRNKVPALILNATTLNTGNAWQFTATYMGEPRMGDELTDGSDRLRRFYYNRKDTPREYKKVRLGCAVAASACVPGLFEPVSFPGLYEKKPENANKAEKITVQLVDGGVYDNQGVESLLEQNCTRILMSDASGQLDVNDEPGAGRISALFRATSILQNRVRNTLYRNYDARGRTLLLQVLMSVHLKKGLTEKSIPWRGCNDIADLDWEPPRPKNVPLPYGILETIQQSLSRIRTDLDSFSDKEAYALMASGYYMAKKDLAVRLGQEFSDSEKPHHWPFLTPQMTREFQPSACQQTEEPQPSAFIQLLNVGQYRLFKAWRISKLLRVLSYGVLLATVTAIGWMGYTHMEKEFFRNRLDLLGMSFDLTLTCGGVALLLLAAISYLFLELKGLRLTGWVSRWAASLGIGLVGWLPASIHLLVFDRLFLKQGRLDPRQESTEGSRASDPEDSGLTVKP